MIVVATVSKVLCRYAYNIVIDILGIHEAGHMCEVTESRIFFLLP